jgi:carboxymethylenebutenolidase
MEGSGMATTVTVTTEDGDMAVYDVAPPDAARSAVVVLQEAFGVNDHIEDVARRFVGAGYRAVAPHLFHRSGDPVLDYGSIDKLMPHLQGLSESGLLIDLDATLDHLAGEGFGARSTGVVGFCMGGSVTVLASARRPLGAGVTFYGGGVAQGRFGMPSLLELAPLLQTPWLGLFGDDDAGIPVDQVEALAAAAATASVESEVVRYPGAGHGFHCDARPDAFHRTSAEDGWARTLGWFDAHLDSRR